MANMGWRPGRNLISAGAAPMAHNGYFKLLGTFPRFSSTFWPVWPSLATFLVPNGSKNTNFSARKPWKPDFFRKFCNFLKFTPFMYYMSASTPLRGHLGPPWDTHWDPTGTIWDTHWDPLGPPGTPLWPPWDPTWDPTWDPKKGGQN